MNPEPTLIASAARALPEDRLALVEAAGNAEIILLGEASHGTREFYATRADLTKRLIQDQGIRIIALEADWPDTLRLHRYVTGTGDDPDVESGLQDFQRFPTWMWRNTVMVEFARWLHHWNKEHPKDQVSIYGLDLYSLHSSIEAVLRYLDKVDAGAARRARDRYSCFDNFGRDAQSYAYRLAKGGAESCENEVIAQLAEMRRKYGNLVSIEGYEKEFFYAEQNARLVASAERYYRAMFRGREEGWNLRDEHMTETLLRLIDHHAGAKTVVWAHNSHLGDARATEMGGQGEWNVGQLVRERSQKRVFSVGFTTYDGTVTAARNWGEACERRRVRPALRESYEALFHATRLPSFWLDLREKNSKAVQLLQRRRLLRAIGVIYRPETERWSHYVMSALPDQFDAVVHLDRTHALEPLEKESAWVAGELPETYPSGV